MRAIYVLSVALLLIAGASAYEWSVCEKESNLKHHVSDVVLKPDPLKPGDTAVFTIRGTSEVETTSGVTTIKVKYLGLPIFSEEDDICKLNDCPIPKGKFETTFSKHFPIYTPPGSYTTKIVSRDGNGDLLTCLEIKFSVKLLSQS